MNALLGQLILILSLVAFVLLAIFFIVCRRYEDGVVGNVALGLMGFAAGMVLWDAARGQLEIPPAEYCLLIVSVAVFMVRHAYRFAMFHWFGTFGWGRPRDFDPEQTVSMRRVP